MKRLILDERAAAEWHEAVAWYEAQRDGLGGEFREAVETTMANVQQNPQGGAKYRRTPFRYRLVRRFPYVVFYIENDDAIQIVAIAHGHRRPGYWRRRTIE